MIEFKGPLTGEAEKFLLKKQVQILSRAMIIVAILFGTPIIVSAIFIDLAILLFLTPIVLMLAFSFITPGKNNQKTFMPKRVFIDLEENMIVHQCEKMERFHNLDSVKRVFDYGDWYYFKFDYANRDMYFVCQKDLISQGTIDEFEELFKDKIERKGQTENRPLSV